MPKVKKTLRQMQKVGVAPKTSPPSVRKVISNEELHETILDLIQEIQNLNSNMGKFFYKLAEGYGVEREIPDDEIPF